MTNFKTYYIMLQVTGEWLNGRVAVSKTVGCVFESRLPCQTLQITISCGLKRFSIQDIDCVCEVATKLATKVATKPATNPLKNRVNFRFLLYPTKNFLEKAQKLFNLPHFRFFRGFNPSDENEYSLNFAYILFSARLFFYFISITKKSQMIALYHYYLII